MATVLDCPIKYSPHTKETALGSPTAASLCCTTLWLCQHNVKHELCQHNVKHELCQHNVKQELCQHNVKQELCQHNVKHELCRHNVKHELCQHIVNHTIHQISYSLTKLPTMHLTHYPPIYLLSSPKGNTVSYMLTLYQKTRWLRLIGRNAINSQSNLPTFRGMSLAHLQQHTRHGQAMNKSSLVHHGTFAFQYYPPIHNKVFHQNVALTSCFPTFAKAPHISTTNVIS
jgi:hypothetical protein